MTAPRVVREPTGGHASVRETPSCGVKGSSTHVTGLPRTAVGQDRRAWISILEDERSRPARRRRQTIWCSTPGRPTQLQLIRTKRWKTFCLFFRRGIADDVWPCRSVGRPHRCSIILSLIKPDEAIGGNRLRRRNCRCEGCPARIAGSNSSRLCGAHDAVVSPADSSNLYPG